MSEGALPDPLFRRIDHLRLRCEPAAYDRVLELFRDTLGLPAPWPVSRHASFISGGVALGNVPLEILQGRGLLGAKTPEGITIHPEKVFGLRFALTG